MSHTLSNPVAVRLLVASGVFFFLSAKPVTAFVVPLGVSSVVAVQGGASVLSSEYLTSGREASLKLELAGGRTLEMAIADGGVFIDGERVGDAARGGELDRQWRELLAAASVAAPTELPQLLMSWTADGATGRRMGEALQVALQEAAAAAGHPGVAAPAAPSAPPTPDSVRRLNERIAELEQRVQTRERVVVNRGERNRNPFRYIMQGIAGIFSIMVTYVVLFAIAFGVIFFGGRRYIEGVADTARHATGRSFLVGMAASFLIVPAFVLGLIALVISIVGIPGILVWVPGFPVAVVLGILLGYISVAHAIGESFSERRYYVTDWFQRGNSYYFLLSGFGLLLALFLASQVVHMAGPWLRAISAILIVLGVVSTVAAVLTGFGAVLISRAGTRPVRTAGTAETETGDLFE